MNNFCLYHKSCNDGFASALAVWQRFGDTFEYIAVQYGDHIPEMEDINELYIVDFSFPEQEMRVLEERSRKLTIIDHHDIKSAWQPKEGNTFIWDESHCGSYLTYQYLFPGKHIPNFFLYIEDRDLWKWQLPDSREFSAGMDLEDKNFRTWDQICNNEYMLSNVIDNGSTILRFINQKVRGLAEKAIILKDESGLICAIVNSPLFQSEIGEYLCENKDIDYADIYFVVEGPIRKIVHSLRSIGRANVTDIAKSKNGGGHPSGRTAGYSEIL